MLLALSASPRMRRTVSQSKLAWRGASRFVAGETIGDAMEVVEGLNRAGLVGTLDHLGENVATAAEAARARDAYLEALQQIDARGVRSGISLKLTALGLDLGHDVAVTNLREVVVAAAGYDRKIFVRIDMESSAYTQRTIDVFHELFPAYRNVGVVIQSYLYRSDADVDALCAEGAHVRLVKGAYLEPPAVAHPDKRDVDAAFIRQATRLLSGEARGRGVVAALATHDEAIIDWATAHARIQNIPQDAFEFQMLYGIRRDLQDRLVADGYRVRVYIPYGREWYPYFMRRLAERPENVGFVLRNLSR
jgi:proline dehydrogenase